MYYYFVWVRSNRYHGSEPDTPAATENAHSGVVIEGISKSFGSGYSLSMYSLIN